MVNNNELRKGNWLMAPLGEYVQVDVIGHLENENYVHASKKTDRGSISGQNGFEPVPLTPEILEKAGFVGNKLNNFYFFTNGNLIIEGYENDYNGLFIGKIESLHQLQNLYFALTGKELEIKL